MLKEAVVKTEDVPAGACGFPSIEIDVAEIESPVLARLIEEVRNQREPSIHMYNRMHNRHNRSR